MTDQHFSIQFAALQSNLSVHTIRAWEKRYQVVTPQRDNSGRRQYSRDEIKKLKTLSELTKLGNPISEMAKLESPDLYSLHSEFVQTDTKKNFSDLINPDLTVQNLILALNSYKLDIISHEFEKLKTIAGPKSLVLQVLTPLIKEIKLKLSNNELTRSQVKALVSVIKFHMGHSLYQHICSTNCSPFSFVIATQMGVQDELQLMMSAILCSEYNIKFYYLGTDFPAESLSHAVNQIGCEYILLSDSTDVSQFSRDVSKGLKKDVTFLSVGTTESSSNVKSFETLTAFDHFLQTLHF